MQILCQMTYVVDNSLLIDDLMIPRQDVLFAANLLPKKYVVCLMAFAENTIHNVFKEPCYRFYLC
jgi:hypothetical protein